MRFVRIICDICMEYSNPQNTEALKECGFLKYPLNQVNSQSQLEIQTS